MDFALKVINWDPKTEVRLQLWDIAGKDNKDLLQKIFYLFVHHFIYAFFLLGVSGTNYCPSQAKRDSGT